MIPRHQKAPSIIRLLDGLRARLGQRAFDVVDHWEIDEFAVGIARPDNHSVLAYISTDGKKGERSFVSLELPAAAESNSPYVDAGSHEATSFDELAAIVRGHFERHS